MKKLFTNAKIFTSDRGHLYADAMLVEDGRILWIGTGEPADEPDEVIDLQGKTVIPGLIDAHMHPLMLAEYSKQIACLPPKANSIEELIAEIARVRQEIAAGSDADREELPWIRGWGYDEGKYAEKRSPNRYDLDRGSKDYPVFLVRSCEHIRCVNSKALEIAGITKDTPDPPGGSIDRDEKGEPTGVLRENARNLVLPFMPEETEAEIVDALVDLGQLLISQGIVAIGDMGNLHPGGNLTYFIKAAERGFLQRVSLYYMWDYFMDNPEFEIPDAMMDYESRIRIAGIKLIGDGSISGKTAWLHRPYLGTDLCGMPVYSDESMEKAIDFAKKAGCQIAVHAMGGRAVDRVIDRVCRESDWTDGRVPFVRIEHVTEPSEQAMTTAAEKGYAFVAQPIFEYSEIETYKVNMDEQRLKQLYPFRTELDHGIQLAFSTDAPATSWAVPSDPFSNIKAATTRKAYDGSDIGQDEKVDIETAVILYTRKAAHVCGFAGLGQLTPGYAADFAILSEDIFTIDPAQIDQIKVEATYICGERVY
ncbi:MAG: amidohydrolase [Firmicutes bacterium]|nr:amidohydrolase [Bacillota bacterium]